MFGISETFLHITVFPRFFLSHSSEKLREEPSNDSDSFKCQVSKKLMQKNGISRLSVENFLSQSAEKFRWGTLISEKFGYRKISCLKVDITFLR